jgi:hypothetical protein
MKCRFFRAKSVDTRIRALAGLSDDELARLGQVDRYERTPEGSPNRLTVRRKPRDQSVLKMLSPHFSRTYGDRLQHQHSGHQRDAGRLWRQEPVTQAVRVISFICNQVFRRRDGTQQRHGHADVGNVAGVSAKATGRPPSSARQWIFEVRPPRERPTACAHSPLLRLLPSGAPSHANCRG